jgi:hypothetical protein
MDVTARLTDPRRASVARLTRGRRQRRFLEQFPQLAQMRVLDLGGAAGTWLELDAHPAEVVLLNIPWVADRQENEIAAAGVSEWMRAVGGDACDPPPELREQQFDLVFSNSVIEHVGGYERRRLFAKWTRELGEHYWMQTPNRNFPVEPHWLFPWFQFLPPAARAWVTGWWPLGNFTRLREKPYRERLWNVLEIELVSLAELKLHFPDGEIQRERLGPLTKSYVFTR